MAAVDLWFNQIHNQAIEKINEKLQLEYLLLLFKSKDEYIERLFKEDSIESTSAAKSFKELIILTMKLLCEYKKEQVIDFVKKKYLPVQEVLEICKVYNANMTVAYLYKRIGEYTKAFDIYVPILKDYAEQFFNSTTTQVITDYKTVYEKTLKLCKMNTLVSNDNQLWFTMLKHLYEVFREITKRKQDENYLSNTLISQASILINDCIRKLLHSMLDCVSLESIIEEMTTNYEDSQLADFNQIFEPIINIYFHQSKLLETVRKIVRCVTKKSIDNIIKCKTKGTTVSNSFCAECRYNINTENYYMFPCGHLFHKQCIESTKRCSMCYKASGSITCK